MACSSPRRAATSMSVVAASCGTWLTTATSLSWWSGVTASTSAPSERTRVRTAWNASSSVRSVGVSTQVAPTNMSGVGTVEPVLLGPGHRVARRRSGPRGPGRAASTACTMAALAEPTSVTSGAPASSAATATSAASPTGTATITTSAPATASASERRDLVDRADAARRRRRAGVAVEPAHDGAAAPQREPDRASDEARSRRWRSGSPDEVPGLRHSGRSPRSARASSRYTWCSSSRDLSL